MPETAVILSHGLLGTPFAKTTHGLVRGPSRYQILGVVDPESAGHDAGELLDGRHRGIPVFGSLSALIETAREAPDVCVVGVATVGGVLPPEIRSAMLEAACSRDDPGQRTAPAPGRGSGNRRGSASSCRRRHPRYSPAQTGRRPALLVRRDPLGRNPPHRCPGDRLRGGQTNDGQPYSGRHVATEACSGRADLHRADRVAAGHPHTVSSSTPHPTTLSAVSSRELFSRATERPTRTSSCSKGNPVCAIQQAPAAPS